VFYSDFFTSKDIYG